MWSLGTLWETAIFYLPRFRFCMTNHPWHHRNLNSVGLAFDFLTVNPSNIKTCSNIMIPLKNEFRDVVLDIESNLKTVRKAGSRPGIKINL